MAKTVFTNPSVKYKDSGGTVHDISSQVQSATIDSGVEEQDSTAFGDNTRLNVTGLKTWSASVTMFQDFSSAAEIDAVFFDELGASSAGEIEIVPDAGTAVGKNNPAYYGSVYLTSFPPFGQAVGDVMTVDAEFTAAGELTRNTTSQI